MYNKVKKDTNNKCVFFFYDKVKSNIFVTSKRTPMRNLFFSLAALVLSPFAFGQIGGNHAYQFLTLVGSPRQAALGGNVITNYDSDVNQPLFNPASINEEMNQRVALNFGKYYGDVSYGTAAYSRTFANERNFHVGISYLNYGSIEGYDELGLNTGTFSGNDLALSLGYAHHIVGTYFHFGTNIKVISSHLDTYSSFGAAADIAGMYTNPETGWNIAMSFRNIGTQLSTYNDVREPLPFDVLIGFSKQLDNVPIRWHFTLDQLQKWEVSFSNPNRSKADLDGTITEEKVSFFNTALRHMSIAAEFFPEKKFNLRLGYNFRKGEEMKILEQRQFAGLSAGFGLQINRFKFDYSYSRYTLAANTSLFGLSMKL